MIRSALQWLKSLVWKGGNGYASTAGDAHEFTDGWAPDPSPDDTALAAVHEDLVAQCRDLARRSAKARGIENGFRADVVGQGIGIEPVLPRALAALVPTLRDGFNAWAESAGANGDSLWLMQWTAAGDVVTSGAFLWRWVTVDDAQGIPLRLLALETEWLSPEPLREVPAHRFAAGCEFDALGRPVFWHLRNPATGEPDIVPAADIIHGFIPLRARQHVGEPVLAPLVLRLLQDERLVLIELRAAVNTSNVAGVIETEDADLLLGGPAGAKAAPAPGAPPKTGTAGSRRLRPGAVLPLRPGEKWTTVENKRPAQGIAPFRQSMDGDLAAGAGLSRQWLDRDSARANYSSQREDNVRTSRVIGPLQAALGRAMASRVYQRLVPYLLIQAGQRWPASPRERAALLRHELRPDRIPYVDPEKEAGADVYQVEHNLATLEEVLAAKGRDLGTVLAKRAAEQAAIDEQTIERVKRLAQLAKASGIEGLTWAHLITLGGASSAPGAYLGAAVGDAPAPASSADDAERFAGLRLVRDERGEVVEIQPAPAVP